MGVMSRAIEFEFFLTQRNAEVFAEGAKRSEMFLECLRGAMLLV